LAKEQAASENIQYGILIIVEMKKSKRKVHVNAIQVDHNRQHIERFEPYGSRHDEKNRDCDLRVDKRIVAIVSQAAKKPYTLNRFYPEGVLGAQSLDLKGTGYCMAWSIIYIECKQLTNEKETKCSTSNPPSEEECKIRGMNEAKYKKLKGILHSTEKSNFFIMKEDAGELHSRYKRTSAMTQGWIKAQFGKLFTLH